VLNILKATQEPSIVKHWHIEQQTHLIITTRRMKRSQELHSKKKDFRSKLAKLIQCVSFDATTIFHLI